MNGYMVGWNPPLSHRKSIVWTFFGWSLGAHVPRVRDNDLRQIPGRSVGASGLLNSPILPGRATEEVSPGPVHRYSIVASSDVVANPVNTVRGICRENQVSRTSRSGHYTKGQEPVDHAC